MKKIGIDARCLMDGRKTGVEEYTLNVLENLFSIDKKNEYRLFLNSWKKPKLNFKRFDKYQNVKIIFTRVPNKILNFFFWYFSWPKIDEILGGIDILWMPNIAFGAFSKKTKLVLTVHDLSFERYPEYFSLKRKIWHVFINPRKFCRRADKIIAVSRSTKSDLVNLYRIKDFKIKVIYSAVNEKFKVLSRNDGMLIEIKEKYRLPYKYILYFGTVEPRKNITGVIKAFNELQEYAEKRGPKNIEKFELVIAGEKGWKNEKIFEEIEKSRFKEKIKVIMPVPDYDKIYIYNLASLFVFPSFLEGFGFPPLEALSCGVPVISSNNSSLPEILEDAAILIDPDKPSELFQAMKQVIMDQELRELLIKKGLEKAVELSWVKSVKTVQALFD